MKNITSNVRFTTITFLLLATLSCTNNQKEKEVWASSGEKYLVLSPEEYHDLLLTKGELVYVPVYS
jgi:hypothetical protein